jgi:hypothetical protein
MTRHPRGKQLPNALSLMIEYLSDEQFLLLKRIDSVKTKLARITDLAPEKPANGESVHTNGAPEQPVVEEPAVETPIVVEQTAEALPLAEAPPLEAPVEPPPTPPAPPAAPTWAAPVSNSPADFLSHLIENVTQTGTESAPQEPEAAPAEEETPLFDPGDFRHLP